MRKIMNTVKYSLIILGVKLWNLMVSLKNKKEDIFFIATGYGNSG